MKCDHTVRRAAAQIHGSREYSRLRGTVTFQQRYGGVLVTAEILGLPENEKCSSGIFGFHIHAGTQCSGTTQMPFSNADGHFNPQDCPHPYHAGDMPPLFGNHGYAYLSFFTDRFTVAEIVGRVVIIHRNPDDFTTQPSGNSGPMIACGKIIAGNQSEQSCAR